MLCMESLATQCFSRLSFITYHFSVFSITFNNSNFTFTYRLFIKMLNSHMVSTVILYQEQMKKMPLLSSLLRDVKTTVNQPVLKSTQP